MLKRLIVGLITGFIMGAIVAAVLSTLVAAWFPALRAARMNPVDVMR